MTKWNPGCSNGKSISGFIYPKNKLGKAIMIKKMVVKKKSNSKNFNSSKKEK